MSYPPPAGPDPYGQQPDPYAQQPNPYAPPPAAESPIVPGSPAAPPPYGQPPYAPPYAQPYAQQPQYGYAPQAATNGLAIASMVMSLVSIFTCWLFLAIPGAIMGHVALKKLRETGEQGEGMAKAGIIIGWIVTGLSVLVLLCYGGIIIAALNDSSTSSSY